MKFNKILIKIGTSQGVIIPYWIIKSKNLKVGDKISLKICEDDEL